MDNIYYVIFASVKEIKNRLKYNTIYINYICTGKYAVRRHWWFVCVLNCKQKWNVHTNRALSLQCRAKWVHLLCFFIHIYANNTSATVRHRIYMNIIDLFQKPSSFSETVGEKINNFRLENCKTYSLKRCFNSFSCEIVITILPLSR